MMMSAPTILSTLTGVVMRPLATRLLVSSKMTAARSTKFPMGQKSFTVARCTLAVAVGRFLAQLMFRSK